MRRGGRERDRGMEGGMINHSINTSRITHHYNDQYQNRHTHQPQETHDDVHGASCIFWLSAIRPLKELGSVEVATEKRNIEAQIS